jgi:hypothetical protein
MVSSIQTNLVEALPRLPTHKKHPEYGNTADNHHDEIKPDDKMMEPMLANWSLP